MRSYLFVPADSERKLEKGLVSGADGLIVDLEDSVAAEAKPRARELAARFVAGTRADAPCRIFVRVNPFSSGMTEPDLAAIMAAAPHGIVLPKAEGMESARRLAAMLDLLEEETGIPKGSTAILPIITETAAGVLAAPSWSGTFSRLAGVTWGAEDLSADLGISAPRDGEGRYTDAFRHARTMTILAAGACRTEPVDTVFVDFRDEDGLARECAGSARDGFTGKLAIHPAQVPVINAAFSVPAEAVAAAEAVVAAFQRAGNPGVVAIEGRMYDRPHLNRAERILARAARQKR
jgi:citrate lyase subunit beta/citryl-CoA lyase